MGIVSRSSHIYYETINTLVAISNTWGSCTYESATYNVYDSFEKRYPDKHEDGHVEYHNKTGPEITKLSEYNVMLKLFT